jgi:hypothetical protein
VSGTDTIDGVLNAGDANAEMISQICIDLVQTWGRDMSTEDMYRDLLKNAKAPADVDTMLYQLEGDPTFAENAALIVLSAAWHYPQLMPEIKRLAQEASAAQDSDTQRELALSVLYGMYLMARGGAKVEKVAYRDAKGQIKTHALDQTVPAGHLFDAVRDQYAATL